MPGVVCLQSGQEHFYPIFNLSRNGHSAKVGGKFDRTRGTTRVVISSVVEPPATVHDARSRTPPTSRSLLSPKHSGELKLLSGIISCYPIAVLDKTIVS